MEKIKLYANLFGKLETLCEAMQVEVNAAAPNKFAVHLREVYRMGEMLSDEADTLSDHADEAMDALYKKNFVEGIDALSAMVDQMKELQAIVNTAYDELAHSLCALRELTEPAGWSPTCTGEEIQRVIEEGFSLTNSMSLGYQNGQFALLFEEAENDDKFVMEPFVIATGGEDDYEEVRAFVEQFLDMEEEDW